MRLVRLAGVMLALLMFVGSVPPSFAVCGGCDSCEPDPANPDRDVDGVPDQLEHDLAFRFFPSVRLQHLVPDVERSYLFQGNSIPYTVHPIPPTGVCAEEFECLEVRYGIAFDTDCGDFLGDEDPESCDPEPTSPNFGHIGDNESAYALLMRTASWDDAQDDSSQWVLIRDMAENHNTDRYFGWGMCFNCDIYNGFATECNDQPECFIIPESGGQCAQIANVYLECDYPSPIGTGVWLFAAHGKHALFHSDNECDGGGLFGSDDCPTNQFEMRDYLGQNCLQNIGNFPDGVFTPDTTIAAPDIGGGEYDVTSGTNFGDTDPFRDKFTKGLNWGLPVLEPCIDVAATGNSQFTGPDCTGGEFSDTSEGPAEQSWDGQGCVRNRYLRAATIASFRDTRGYCHDLTGPVVKTTLVPVERTPDEMEHTNCLPCPENRCDDVTYPWPSYYSLDECGGWEYFDTASVSDSERSSWDGEGCVGSLLREFGVASYKDEEGWCHQVPSQVLSELARIRRASPQPPGDCPGCDESSCTAATSMSGSRFTGANCTGIEYFEPSAGSAVRASWDGNGCLGDLLQPASYSSHRTDDGFCYNYGGTGEMARVYRVDPPPASCSPCDEGSCTEVSGDRRSLFAGLDCSGIEYYEILNGGIRRSWDGEGCSGDVVHHTVVRSYMRTNGRCVNAWPEGSLEIGLSTIYRPSDDPPPCRGCDDIAMP